MPVYWLCAVLLAADPNSVVPASDAAAVRAAVARSLPFIVERGTNWIENKKCVSCHRIGMMVWALNEAADRGFEVDRTRLQGWIDWSYESGFDESETKVKGADAALNADGLSQLLLGTTAERLPSPRRKKLLDQIIAVRKPDGSWKPEGQLPGQKRPLPETTAVSTMWQSLALLNENDDDYSATSTKPAVGAAAEEIAEPQSTEWWAVRSVLSRKRGNQVEADRTRVALLKRQQPDGGWAWTEDGESDALATGMALYAFADAEFDGKSETVAQAWKFLVSTQRADGGWDVKGTKAAKKDSVQETASYWGATWAVIGLVRTLPR